MENEFVYKYFYYFLKFVMLFQDANHIPYHYDRKKEYVNEMSKICAEHKLKDIDERFWELTTDLDYTITISAKDLNIIFQDYMEFINKF